jgi:tetratricopeptide (TPR) repeat protein
MNRPNFLRAAFFFGMISSCLMIRAQQVNTPRASQASSISQTIGISTVSVKYSRPSVNGREIWGKLVPFGWNKQAGGNGNDAPWRAGANENTVLQLSNTATIQGHSVPAGSYGLFFVINPDNTGEVILSKDFISWGNFFYDPKQDEMREKITIQDVPVSAELLTYSFDNLSKNSAILELNWGKKQFPVKIEFAVDEIVLANATEELKGRIGFGWQSFNSAANYCLANNTSLEQGLAWSDKAIALQNEVTVAPYVTKAGILDLMGKHSESEQIIKDAMAKATETDVNLYGYNLLGKKQYDKAIAVFKQNTQNHPASANVWDSLGEAYALAGDKQNAILNFKKSLGMNPPAPVKANSEKYLKQLGAM